MTDLVERARSPHLQIDSNEVRVLVAEIADEIERLRKDNEHWQDRCLHWQTRAGQAEAALATTRKFHVCEDHKDAEWNQPEIDEDRCILCRLFYLEAQEQLLEEWQQRALRAEEANKEIERPLDAQMARLNETVTKLNEQLATARRDALEEAAKVCEDYAEDESGEGEVEAAAAVDMCAMLIRALAEKEGK